MQLNNMVKYFNRRDLWVKKKSIIASYVEAENELGLTEKIYLKNPKNYSYLKGNGFGSFYKEEDGIVKDITKYGSINYLE